MKKYNRLKLLLNKPITLYERFYEKLKIKKFQPLLPSHLWPKEWKDIYFKGYARLNENFLPRPIIPDNISFRKVLSKRQTTRKFSKKKLPIDIISNLLYYSAGLKQNKELWCTSRFYPSSGARYPLEVYILTLNTDLPKNVYHYYLKNHSLEELVSLAKVDITKFFNQSWVAHASCLILITAIFRRTTVKYGDRGYNYTLIEAGHLGQNFYLVSQALGIGCCAIGGFSENNLNKILDIDGIKESVIYVLAMGQL